MGDVARLSANRGIAGVTVSPSLRLSAVLAGGALVALLGAGVLTAAITGGRDGSQPPTSTLRSTP